MSSLTILIPTFNKPGKLFRQLYYLLRLFKTSKEISFFSDNIKFIIADGSSSIPSFSWGSSFSGLVRDCQSSFNLQYYHLPDVSLHERLVWLYERSDSEYVMYLGDEDLILFDHLAYALHYLDSNINVSTWAGRLINVISYPFFSPKSSLSAAERPFAGFVLDQSSVPFKISTYFALNAVGTNALAYSIQRRSVIYNYIDYISRHSDTLFYGGTELLHQVVSLSGGGVCIDNRPLILRDFMYENYIVEKQREAPQSDPFPYHGQVAIDLCSAHIAENSNLDFAQSTELLLSILRLVPSLQTSRAVVQSNLEGGNFYSEIVADNISALSFSNFQASYLKYFVSAKSFRQMFLYFLRFVYCRLLILRHVVLCFKNFTTRDKS